MSIPEAPASQPRAADLRPLESEVHLQFAFALGMVAGANALAPVQGGDFGELDELPAGYSLAGGKLDELAGDALLHNQTQWYLLELKRDVAAMRTELVKSRVVKFTNNLKTHPLPSDLHATAKTAHQFLFQCRFSKSGGAQLATLGYLEWL